MYNVQQFEAVKMIWSKGGGGTASGNLKGLLFELKTVSLYATC